jgi:hypothetical protein
MGDIVQRPVEWSLHAGFGDLTVNRRERLTQVLWEETVAVCMPAFYQLAVQPAIHPTGLMGGRSIGLERKALLWL